MKHLIILLLAGLSLLTACAQSTKKEESSQHFKVEKSEAEWKAQLTEMEYDVLRNEGTEPAFSGKYVDWKKTGIFTCKACGHALFESETKFKSGTGWPSFYDYIKGNVVEKPDNSYGWNRTEVECANCGSHLGHVFEDGPQPTGLRYCINSVSLGFKAE